MYEPYLNRGASNRHGGEAIYRYPAGPDLHPPGRRAGTGETWSRPSKNTSDRKTRKFRTEVFLTAEGDPGRSLWYLYRVKYVCDAWSSLTCQARERQQQQHSDRRQLADRAVPAETSAAGRAVHGHGDGVRGSDQWRSRSAVDMGRRTATAATAVAGGLRGPAGENPSGRRRRSETGRDTDWTRRRTGPKSDETRRDGT